MPNTSTTSTAQRRLDTVPPGLELLLPLLCLVGLCVATYLSVMHYGLILGDLSLGRVCGGGTWGDCNSVVASRYGTLLGLPVSTWGMWFYVCAGVLALGVVMLRRPDAAAFLRALLILTIAALLFDVYLALGMWRVGRMCPLCVVTYGVNVILLVIAVRCRVKLPEPRALACADVAATVNPGLTNLLPSLPVLFRPHEANYYREVVKTFLLGSAGACCLLILGLALTIGQTVTAREEDKLAGLLEYLRVAEPFQVPIEARPSRGPDDATITIVVFSDFRCEQCKVASQYLDMVAANHRDSLRLVFMHFPVDTDCNEHAKSNMHPGACKLAQAAVCAHAQDRFWEFHDVVYAGPGKVGAEKVIDYAARSSLNLDEFNMCLGASESTPPRESRPTETHALPPPSTAPLAIEVVRKDIDLAHAVGVTATPTLYLNGRPLVGAVKPWMLEAAIESVTAP